MEGTRCIDVQVPAPVMLGISCSTGGVETGFEQQHSCARHRPLTGIVPRSGTDSFATLSPQRLFVQRKFCQAGDLLVRRRPSGFRLVTFSRYPLAPAAELERIQPGACRPLMFHAAALGALLFYT